MITVKIFIGNIIHCTGKLKIELLENGFVAVQGSQVLALGNRTELNNIIEQINVPPCSLKIHYLKKSQILIPGLVDTHIHAPQYPNCGLGYDKTLMDWLDIYTFNLERKYRDLDLAKKVFDAVVRKTLDNGTTTACYFGSLFNEASLVLVDSVISHGQRGFVGKINMTQSPFKDYVETPQETVDNTIKFVEDVLAKQSNLVSPIITPRFAPSLELEDMTQLGKIAQKYNLRIQTHISENLDEISYVKEHFGMSYAEVYETAQLLTNKTILAHGIYLNQDDIDKLKKYQTAIAHCPDSNICLKSGLCDVKHLLEQDIIVGLGTDASGGSSPSIRSAMKSALDTSISVSFNKSNYQPLNYQDVFYLATLGGAKALAIEEKIGNFEAGKQFDALIIDANVNGPIDYLQYCSPLEILQKFIYCGDDRNVVSVFVAGDNLKSL
ncbi:guanine deaminase [Anthonomus grandis grandis]|uniref:guanine deaminase n=1 Tax=Anthonomus grandis grandis TaxID=2921223 RepID=UPI0021653BFD|nr:guanine deaminase [Anthonomus grandis grandis]